MKSVPDNLKELQEPGWKAWGRIFAAAIKADMTKGGDKGMRLQNDQLRPNPEHVY
jgi:hypothetical protein